MNAQETIISIATHVELFVISFWKACSLKLKGTGYIQIDKIFKHYSPTDRQKILRQLKNPVIERYLLKSIVDEESLITTLQRIAEIDIDSDSLDSMTEECGQVIISWLLYCNKQKHTKALRTELACAALRRHNEFQLVDEKYIIHKDMDYRYVEDTASYISVILSVVPKGKMFFRGQSSLNYWIQPSISRNKKHETYEAQLYQELMLRCPSNFTTCRSHLDNLVEMQHYGLPTRLVDISTNPLVALYFSACNQDAQSDGEVVLFDVPEDAQKYERSDTVTILSCLPLFSYNDQQHILAASKELDVHNFNKDETVLRLLHEIKVDKPAFADRIMPTHIRENLVVTPAMKNGRIVKQSGAFIICGLTDDYHANNPLEKFRYRSPAAKKLLLIVRNKKQIIDELRSLDIHRATLFPEIDDVADYLKNEWL